MGLEAELEVSSGDDVLKGDTGTMGLGLMTPVNVRDLRKSEGARIFESRVAAGLWSSVSSRALFLSCDRKDEGEAEPEKGLPVVSGLLSIGRLIWSRGCWSDAAGSLLVA